MIRKHKGYKMPKSMSTKVKTPSTTTSESKKSDRPYPTTSHIPKSRAEMKRKPSGSY